MDDGLEELPSVRIHVVEVPAHPYEPLRFLGPGIDVERKLIVPNFLNDVCRGSCGNFGCPRSTRQRYFTESRSIGRRQDSEHEIFALYRCPVERADFEDFLAGVEIAEKHVPRMVILSFEAVGK